MEVVTRLGASALAADGQPLFVDFVNTLHWYEGVAIELIATPADLGAWLLERHLPAEDPAAALGMLHRLRDHLRAITEALASGAQPPDADLGAVIAALAAPVGHLAWTPAAAAPPTGSADSPTASAATGAAAPVAGSPASPTGAAAHPTPRAAGHLAFATDAAPPDVLVAFQIALSLVTFLESGPRHRLKLCANPGCGFAFVDTSINGTRRWCFMRYCGNRLKARAFRTRGRVSIRADAE